MLAGFATELELLLRLLPDEHLRLHVRLYAGSMEDLLRLYERSMKALLRVF